jgi:hypothetical protein
MMNYLFSVVSRPHPNSYPSILKIETVFSAATLTSVYETARHHSVEDHSMSLTKEKLPLAKSEAL